MPKTKRVYKLEDLYRSRIERPLRPFELDLLERMEECYTEISSEVLYRKYIKKSCQNFDCLQVLPGTFDFYKDNGNFCTECGRLAGKRAMDRNFDVQLIARELVSKIYA